jgi:hypothetical protein
LVPVTGLTFREDRTGSDIEGRKQRGGAVADIVVCDSLDVSQAHGQERLGAIQSLNLALFINGEHQGVIGRIQVQAHNVAHLFNKEGVRGQFEPTAAVRLERKSLKQAMVGSGRLRCEDV